MDSFYTEDGRIIRWHITDDGELDYTIYVEGDGGRLDVSTDDSVHEMLAEL